MDLMASSANVQVDPSGRSLPFYSRYYIATARNTDVFAQHIGRDPISNSEAPLNYCFPPYALLLTFLNHLKMCKGRCVVIMPRKKGSSEWSLASNALVDSRELSTNLNGSDILIFYQDNFVAFRSKYLMVAVLLDFSL